MVHTKLPNLPSVFRHEEQGAINQRIGQVIGDCHGQLAAAISHTQGRTQGGYNELASRVGQLEKAKDTSPEKKPHPANADQPMRDQDGPSGSGPLQKPTGVGAIATLQ